MKHSAYFPIRSGLLMKSLTISLLLLSSIGAIETYAQDDLEWHGFEDALAIADSTQWPLFVDVWAPWCGWCRKMKRDVYPQLKQALEGRFVLTRLNRDDNNDAYNYMGSSRSPKRIAQELKTQSVPAIVFLNSKGEYISHVSGFIEAKKLKSIFTPSLRAAPR
jgi:thioredoxin-related protein